MTLNAVVWGALLGTGAALHCAGMCGVIGCAFLATSNSARPALVRLLTMQAGRILSYVLLGLLFGAAGAGLYRAFDFTGVHAAMQWTAAALVVWIGLSTAGLVPSFAGLDRAFAPVAGTVARMRAMLSQAGAELDLVSGLVWGLTPCPLVYLAIFNAMLLGSTEESMIMMAVFGMVTSVPVVISALALHQASTRSGRPGRVLAGVFIASAGVLAVLLTAPGSPFCIT
ncbi:sulfite exporter TauE/SafE family protein [uncultured Devosia sp.]|mgnify:CR=1 FL=1|uniref:sulfite exporter TauE/SafE family protein n=1 Tax=uncultured Devosia sp. TaxID=211434 RepID=UPI00262123DE|nr:sulfite exporter TauE/SafE family protein [uncultured Devosia sp.]